MSLFNRNRWAGWRQSVGQTAKGWQQQIRQTDWRTLALTAPGQIRAAGRRHVQAFRARRLRDQWLIGGGAALLLTVVVLLLNYLNGDSSPLKRGKPPVPVAVQAVTEGAFPVLVDGLGTVTARREVVIRTRIDGQLDKVLFQEGQMVPPNSLSSKSSLNIVLTAVICFCRL